MKKENKIEKAKDKAKRKLATKLAKVATKTGEAVGAIALIALIAGCMAPGDMEQPARSQTMNNTFRDCVIIANARQVALDTKAKTLDAEADTMSAPLELWTQTQANEGSETVTPTATSTPSMTIDTDAALDIPVNKANSGTSAATGTVGALEKLAGAGADWVTNKINGTGQGQESSAKGTGENAKTAAGGCEGGDCDIGGDCSDGSCDIGGCEGGNCNIK